MTREEKIKFAMAFLAPLLFEKEFQGPNEPVQITFTSSLGAEVKRGDNEPEAIRFGTPFRLHDVIRNIAEYNADGECKHWEEMVADQHEEEDFEEVDGDIKYDPELIPDHIYHSIVFCRELVEDYFS